MGRVWHSRALCLYSWRFQARQVQNYVSLQQDYGIPCDFTVTDKTMNNCSTVLFHNACNILTCIQQLLFKGQNKVKLCELEYRFVVKMKQTA